jgi:exonuclease VII small subunit
MKRFSLVLLLTLASLQASAQALYKYVDANGKVTYSDKAPKAGEKAERMLADTTTNVISSPAARGGVVVRSVGNVNGRIAEQDKLRASLDAAEIDLERAKKALEDGQAPQEGEQLIVVKKNAGNAVLRTEGYRERIASLEAAVKAAEGRLEQAQSNYRRGDSSSSSPGSSAAER